MRLLRFLNTFTLFLSCLMLPSLSSASEPCDVNAFLNKVCVSNQTLETYGDEVAQLVCEDQSQHTGIYSALGKAFDYAPPWFQNQLCKVSQINVYNPAEDPGDSVYSWANSPTTTIGISKRRLERDSGMAAHMMSQAKRWKTVPEGEKFPRSFGYQNDSADMAGTILYGLAHEMGHLLYNPEDLDFRAKYLHECDSIMDTLFCPDFQEEQFGFIDWVDGTGELKNYSRGTIRPQHEEIQSFVLADAETLYTPESADQFFRRLHNSSFVSPYALHSPEEDFCETFAHIVLSQTTTSLRFRYLSGKSIDVLSRVRRPEVPGLKAKVRLIEELLRRMP